MTSDPRSHLFDRFLRPIHAGIEQAYLAASDLGRADRAVLVLDLRDQGAFALGLAFGPQERHDAYVAESVQSGRIPALIRVLPKSAAISLLYGDFPDSLAGSLHPGPDGRFLLVLVALGEVWLFRLPIPVPRRRDRRSGRPEPGRPAR